MKNKLTVIVGSTNKAKIKAVEIGFGKLFPKSKLIIKGCAVNSGVSDQPKGDQETLSGAINRCHNSSTILPNADFWVGLEGGVVKNNDEYESYAWIVIKHQNKLSRGKTGTFILPKAVGDLIDQGKELGEADDIVFGLVDSKKGIGAVGILTNGVIDRSNYYATAVILALIPFIK